MENESIRDLVMETLLEDGKQMLIELEKYWIHPDAGYIPIPDYTKFDFGSLEAISRQLWNAIICVDGTLNADDDFADLKYNVLSFLTMECPPPPSNNAMCEDMWQQIILLALDTDYDPGMDWLGGYKKLKYIQRAIKRFPTDHGLDNLAKQKYALAILIETFYTWKDEIMHLYPGEIDTPEKYYRELKGLISQVSGNGYENNLIVHPLFTLNTFDFMKNPFYQAWQPPTNGQ